MPIVRTISFPNALAPEIARARLHRLRYRQYSPARWLRAAPVDALAGVEKVLVPNWLVQMDVAGRGTAREADMTRSHVVVDCLSGECRAVPTEATLGEADVMQPPVEVPGLTPADEAKKLAVDALRWQMVRSGSKARELRLTPTKTDRIYIAAWVGYFANHSGACLRLRCLNGADGMAESASYGIKLMRYLGAP